MAAIYTNKLIQLHHIGSAKARKSGVVKSRVRRHNSEFFIFPPAPPVPPAPLLKVLSSIP